MSEAADTARAARRTGLVFAGVVVAATTMTLAWVLPEMKRIARNNETRQRDARAGSDMVRVPGGAFTMGANDGAQDEQPIHDVRVNEFWMDRTEVTNAEFEKFVKATGYLTTAELAQPQPGSWCFQPSENAKAEDRATWSAFISGASWRRPRGAGSGIEGKEKFPVVHVSHDDALAYCKWAGKRLPTEAEWECAARGGVILTRYPWGNDGRPESVPGFANVWRGDFPGTGGARENAGMQPVGKFPANAFGLQDIAGNAAEWCADWYQHDYYAQLRPDPDRAAHRNPRGPEVSSDPAEPRVWKRVVRGGSWLGTAGQCRVSARGKEAPGFSAEWLGFRCVKGVQ